MTDWLLLLPPSETKAMPPKNGMKYDGARKKKATNAYLGIESHRERLMDALVATMERGTGLERMFELHGEALEEAIRLNRGLKDANALPAVELYAGVLYQALDWKTLSKKHRDSFAKHTLIISGLFGVVRPSDRIPPYKLKINANLGGVIGKVANFWRKPVSEIVRAECKGCVVWDFLPDEHRRVWDGSGEFRGRHSVKFVKRVVHQGVAEWKTISHHSKSLKGALVRHLLKRDPTDPGSLEDFEHEDGYAYDPSLSVVNNRSSLLVFAAK